MAKKKKAAAGKDPSFEQCLEELAAVVARLESGELSLDDSLAQYELGVKRLNACYKHLSVAERRIELVRGVDARGNPLTEPFDDGETNDMMESPSQRSQKRSARQRADRTQISSDRPDDESTTLF